MDKANKLNLFLLHSFPTNSILLAGLIDYLRDFFQVYPLDLPGFTKAVPPLDSITLRGFSSYIEQEIDESGLDRFVIAGISAGFLFINDVMYDDRCQGIIALEPFLGAEGFSSTSTKLLLYRLGIKAACTLKIYDAIWQSRLWREYFPKIRHYPKDQFDVMLEQIDPRTFFETASILLNDKHTIRYHADIPYLLIANPEDTSIKYDHVIKEMTEKIEKLLVLKTDLDHYPPDTSKEYFRAHIPEEVFEQTYAFFSNSKQPQDG